MKNKCLSYRYICSNNKRYHFPLITAGGIQKKQRQDRDNGNPWGRGLPGQRHQEQSRDPLYIDTLAVWVSTLTIRKNKKGPFNNKPSHGRDSDSNTTSRKP